MATFDINHAKKYGLKEAIILNKIIFYVLKNEQDKRNLKKGRYWTFNSREGWRETFQIFSYDQVWRSLKNLEKKGALVSDSFNRKAYDKTRWYSLSDSLVREVKGSEYWQKAIRKTATSDRKNAKPIPYNNNKEIINIKPY
jgi:hypothetical protein